MLWVTARGVLPGIIPGLTVPSSRPRSDHPLVREYARAVCSHAPEELARRGNRLVCDRRDTIEKEVEPRLPVAIDAHGVEPAIVVLAVTLEKETQVEERLLQEVPVLEEHMTKLAR
jgi:hypothetical protein